MADLQRMAPRINWDDLTQTAALPLGSWIKTDPWDDKVHMLNAKRYAPMNPRDKMPFEVTPIFYKLQRYDVTRVEVPTAPATAAPAPAPATAPATAAPPAGGDQPTGDQPTGDQPGATPGAAPPSSPPAEQPTAGDAATTQQQTPAAPPNQQ
jgi:hypothetical protein